MSAEQVELQAKLDRLTDERDKAQKQLDKSNYIFNQHSQVWMYYFLLLMKCISVTSICSKVKV